MPTILIFFFNEKGNFLRLIYGCFITFIDNRYLLLHYTIIHNCTLYITCALIFKSKTNLALIIVTLACNLCCSMNNSINCTWRLSNWLWLVNHFYYTVKPENMTSGNPDSKHCNKVHIYKMSQDCKLIRI